MFSCMVQLVMEVTIIACMVSSICGGNNSVIELVKVAYLNLYS